MTPPQASEAAVDAHPMTAQAGAVAAHRLHTSDGKAAWRWVGGLPSQQALDDARNFGWTMEYAYFSPPAAVPVEALEGLVADMRGAADETSDHYEAKSLRLFARRLTQLIKERSNG